MDDDYFTIFSIKTPPALFAILSASASAVRASSKFNFLEMIKHARILLSNWFVCGAPCERHHPKRFRGIEGGMHNNDD